MLVRHSFTGLERTRDDRSFQPVWGYPFPSKRPPIPPAYPAWRPAHVRQRRSQQNDKYLYTLHTSVLSCFTPLYHTTYHCIASFPLALTWFLTLWSPCSIFCYLLSFVSVRLLVFVYGGRTALLSITNMCRISAICCCNRSLRMKHPLHAMPKKRHEHVMFCMLLYHVCDQVDLCRGIRCNEMSKFGIDVTFEAIDNRHVRVA